MITIQVPQVVNGEEITTTETAYDCNDFPYTKYVHTAETVRKKRKTYYNIPCTFDIETTSINNDTQNVGFMYLWAFCLNDTVCMGRTWKEYQTFIEKLSSAYSLQTGSRLVVYCHFLAFEFQFFRNFFEVQHVFAKSKRNAIIVTSNSIEYRCSYALSNMSLAKFCKYSKLCTYRKLDGDEFDYSVMRTPSTPLENKELAYMYNDVRGLSQCIETLLEDDTLATIPITSTGYVRRHCRKVVQENSHNRELMQKSALTAEQYVLLKTASRGGNVHAMPVYSNMLLDDVDSYDKKSSYPFSMVVDNFPVTKFVEVRLYKKLFDYIEKYACLIDITFDMLQVKTVRQMAYISKAKCTYVKGSRIDNGRIISAQVCSMVVTDIDLKIILETYNFNNFNINKMYISDYGKMNNEFRTDVMEMFLSKTKLDGVDPYLYAKEKNKINALFGMILTDICNSDIEYIAGSIDAWNEKPVNIYDALDKYYNSRNSFLSYQHGVWVTANARRNLQDGLNIVKSDGVYCDTDSVKTLGDYKKEFETLNKRIIQQCENNDIKAYIDYNGQRTYLGVWEHEYKKKEFADKPTYSKFITLGAKKYAYTYSGCKDIEITVAGLSKVKGAKYLNENGGFKKFKVNTVVPVGKSGRTSAHYNDVAKPYILEVNGEKILNGSNVAIENVTYTFGISDEYRDFMEMAKFLN